MPVTLRLYIMGSSPRSLRATEAVERLQATLPRDYCGVEVVDLEQNPEAAERDKVIAVPTLIRVSPDPQRRVVGELSDLETVLNRLDIVSPHSGSDV